MGKLLDPLTFPLRGIRLIEASAGTGKTYTIAALYLRLVLGHGGENAFERPLIPPEILVVTFTNAATEELRHRIRGRLTEAAAFFRGQGPGDDYLKALRGDYDAVQQWPGCARLLEQAAQWMDESAIHTIHAWCRQMIRQHAFDCGDLFDLEMTTGEQDFLEEAVRDYWRSHFYFQPPKVLFELVRICPTPQDLMKKITPFLSESPGAPCDPFVMIERRFQAIEEARLIWESDFEAAVARVMRAQADKTLNGNKYRSAALIKYRESLQAWVKHQGPLPADPVLQKFSSTGLKDGTVKNKSAPQHPAFEAMDRLNQTLAELDIGTALIAHAAADVRRRVHQEKERSARVGFDDLLTRLHDALKRKESGKRLARVLCAQFPVALIDEFQDTDPEQYAIFSKIYVKAETEDPGRQSDVRAANDVPLSAAGSRPDAALLMIGDPKQSIYAFRGADIHTYLTARRDAVCEPYTLGKNFRSTEALVQAVNRVFGAGARNPQGPFLFKERIPFEEMAAAGRRDQFVVLGRPVPAMTFWQMPQHAGLNKTGDDGYVRRMADSAAGEIVRLLNLAQALPARAGFQSHDGGFRALCPADIAILVRDRSEAEAMRHALDKRQVRSVFLSDKDSVFNSAAAKSLLSLLRACSEPERETVLRTALATDILALSFERLDQLVQDELAWESEVERFRGYRTLWRRQGVLPMLHLLLRDFDVPARLLLQPGGERVLTNVLHLSELLQAASVGRDGENALIRWLAGQVAQPGTGVEEQILRLESDEDLIRVVTFHKSKGLEYPLVFLPFICSFRRVTAANSPVVRLHDENGRVHRVLKPSEQEIAAADRERLAEDLRMLYVALTRAQYASWMGIGVMGKAPGELHLSAIGYLLSGEEAVPAERLAETLALMKGDCDHIHIEPLPEPGADFHRFRPETAELTPALTFSGNIAQDWEVVSYSALSAGAVAADWAPTGSPDFQVPYSAKDALLMETAFDLPVERVVPESARTIHGFPRGTEPGTFLHAILEWAAREGFASLPPQRSRIQSKIRDLCGRRNWQDWETMLSDWLQKLLCTRILLPDAVGSVTLAGLSPEDYQPEMEFMFSASAVDTGKLDARLTAALQPELDRPRLRENRVNGMLKGYIDLVFCFRHRYYVLDYKSNYLGGNDAAYAQKTMVRAMLEHRYDLQYALYILALHRLLKARLPGYDYRRHMGGAVYLFLRGVNAAGQGIYLDKPPQSLIEALDGDFSGRENRHAAG